MDIGKRLISLRKRKKSAKEIAAVLNLSQPGYSRYENNKSDIPLQYLFKILDYLGYSIADFFEYKEEHFSDEDIELIKNFRTLDQYDQAVIHSMITLMNKRPK